jgi:hypothetical protein
MGDQRFVIRQQAQEAVHDHINRKRGEASQHDWNFIHVAYTKGNAKGWTAIVLVETLSEKIFKVSFDGEPNGGEMKVDTFTRQHTTRYV